MNEMYNFDYIIEVYTMVSKVYTTYISQYHISVVSIL